MAELRFRIRKSGCRVCILNCLSEYWWDEAETQVVNKPWILSENILCVHRFHFCLSSWINSQIYKAFHIYKGCDNKDIIGFGGVKTKRGIIKTLKSYRSGLPFPICTCKWQPWYSEITQDFSDLVEFYILSIVQKSDLHLDTRQRFKLFWTLFLC